MHSQRIALVLSGLLAAPGTIAAQSAPAPAPARVRAPAAPTTPALIARGDSIYHGLLAGGTCSACHGDQGKGNEALAPGFTSGRWLGGDGSYSFIVRVVAQGVATPKQGQLTMPANGGAQLTPLDVRAVAAYVYSLSHPPGK